MKILPLLLLAGCGAAATPEGAARDAVKSLITVELDHLARAAEDLQNAAPTRPWNAGDPAVEKMRSAWRASRLAYERIEGAIAVLFPDVDVSIDGRYENFIAVMPDDDLFDGEGVTGMHALERILWADAIPERVIDLESHVPGYVAAAFPSTAQQASQFRDQLAARLRADVEGMRRDFLPLALDSSAAFRGVIGSMQEQLEKVHLAATSEEESRYAQHTLADMRANLDGAQKTFAAFRAWLVAMPNGAATAQAIEARFSTVAARYAAMPGDSIPPVPADWDPDMPSAAALMTEYGQLVTLLSDECDPKRDGSLVQKMGEAAERLGIPTLPQ